MARLMTRFSVWIAGAFLLTLFYMAPLAAGGHDVDPVFFFVSDELILNDETIEEICIDKREGEKSWLLLTLKPEASERLANLTAAHVDGWLILATRDKIVIKAQIRESLTGQLPIILLSAESEELFDLLRDQFGIADPQICTFDD